MRVKQINGMRSLAVCIVFAVSCLVVVFGSERWKDGILINWDINGYHIYNPALFLYQDIRNCSFYNNIDSLYTPTPGMFVFPGGRHDESGHIVFKFSLGVAIFQAPLFLLTQAILSISEIYPNDGYSPPYQLSVALSTILFTLLGLLILRKFLLKFFNDNITALSLLVIALGTNLFYYASYSPGMSHNYLFFLYSLIIYSSHRWHQNASIKHTAILGLAIGWAVLTRPTDIIVALIPLLWNIYPVALRLEKWKLLKNNIHKILLMAVLFFIPLSIQLIYWKYVSGDFVFYSYREEGFDFLNSEVFMGLFSYRKGWFVYTPLAILGIAGLIISVFFRKYRFYAIPALLYFVVSIYVIFSWHEWYYGGGFGSRPMIQSYALLAFPLAFLFDYLRKKAKAGFIVLLIVVAAGISLNVFQSWQYSRAIIHWSNMTKEYYWRVFLQDHIKPDDLQYLLK